ncbi:MAG: hypothetical protein HYW24_04780 [Candidatus Aenigmarchaeota archaeon]|nr:hypothetical protein [Candidatus Aenigmarchaeota archaeon]
MVSYLPNLISRVKDVLNRGYDGAFMQGLRDGAVWAAGDFGVNGSAGVARRQYLRRQGKIHSDWKSLYSNTESDGIIRDLYEHDSSLRNADRIGFNIGTNVGNWKANLLLAGGALAIGVVLASVAIMNSYKPTVNIGTNPAAIEVQYRTPRTDECKPYKIRIDNSGINQLYGGGC